MPKERVKDSSKKSQERLLLASRIEAHCLEMFPCSNCERHFRKCYVSLDSQSSRCSECVRYGLRCDVEGPTLRDWSAIEREEARLSREIKQVTAELHERLARQSRLLKQQEFVKDRAKEMLQYRLKSLDKLDTTKKKEKQEKGEHERVEHEAQQFSTTLASMPAMSNKELLVFG